MDGIAAAAAVVGLVQAGVQVTTALGRYISSVKEADSSRAKLLDQIRLISAAETTIGGIVNLSPSSRPQALQALIDEWFKEDGLPRKCKRELEELATWLERQCELKGHKKWVKALSWPAKEDKIRKTIRTFEEFMPYFRDVLSIETFNLVESMETRNRNDAFTVAKSELLEWLDGFDCTDKHEFTLRQRQQTTGDWLFKEQLYVDWRNGSIDFIWLHGKAGAGKSVLASAIIDHILSGLADNETLVYFYCDFRNRRCTSAMEVLRSVVKQLLWNSKSDWLPSFSDLTTRKDRGAGPPMDLGVLSDLLERTAGLHERPMVFVDALDECEDMSELLERLVKIFHGRCRLFVTSRTLHTAKEAFPDLPSISLDERVDEVRNDMYFHIRTELQSRSRLKKLDKDLKDEIEYGLMGKADGMFRWVQCQLDRLNGCWSVGDVRVVLDTLPKTLYETYERMLDAIDRTEFGPRIARKALLWLVLALHPLKLSQLTEALSIRSDEPAWDSINAPIHGTDILEICGSLITFDESEGIVTLAHYSVKEYLTSDAAARTAYFVFRPLGWFELVSTSIYSIMLSVRSTTTPSATSYFDRFCHYAVSYGFDHLANCPADRNDVLVSLLLSLQNHVSTHRVAYNEPKLGYPAWVMEVPQLALYIINRFGHLSMLEYYLNRHPVEATEEDNPLVYAALYNGLPRVQLFLDKGLNIDVTSPVHTSQGVCKMSPLTAATLNQTPDYQEQLVEFLLARGCIVPTNAIHSTLLYQRQMHIFLTPSVIRILLGRGADPTLLVAGRKNALHLLLEYGYSDDEFEIARILVTAECNPLALDNHGLSPLHYAIRGGKIKWIKWLIQSGFQLPSDAILHAFPKYDTRRTYVDLLCMIQFLIKNGADIQVRDTDGCNALHYVARHALIFYNAELMASTVDLLLSHGCDINCRNESGETPLHFFATYNPRMDAIKHMVDQGAQLPIDIINYCLKRPLFFFSWGPEFCLTTTILPLVAEHGASCQLATLGGDNALHCMLKRDVLYPGASQSVTRFLLENGCDIHAANSSGTTPLQLAIENGHLYSARLILSKLIAPPLDTPSVIPNVIDPEGNGTLHRLCGKLRGFWKRDLDEFMDRLYMLEELGCNLARDINRPNHKGFTPLCIILGAGHDKLSPTSNDAALVISTLLGLGARFSDVTPLYMDSVEWASNLPWYQDATDGYRLSQSRFRPRFGDVTNVYRLVQLAHSPKIPPPVTRLIMNMAEYWAYTKVIKNNVRYTFAYDGVQIALPVTPDNSGGWIPRRVIFSCKPRVAHPYIRSYVEIDIRIRRPNATYAVPVNLGPRHESPHLPKTVFDVWDKYTPATQSREKGQLMLAELAPTDTFSIEFRSGNDDYFELEFFQVEVYYAIGPTQM